MAELPISCDDAAEEIKAFLLEKGVESVTNRDIRQHLEEKFDCSLSAHKTELERIKLEKIEEIKNVKVEEKSGESSEAESDVADSDEEEEDAPDLPAKEVSTAKSAAKRKASSESESDDELPASEKRTRSAAKRKRQPAKETTAEKAPAKKRKGDSAFTKICELSPELQEVMGRKYMRRHDVVKAMWAYFKEHNLLDPKDRRKVICDEPLKRIFGLKKIQAFGMMGGLKEHINTATNLSDEERDRIIAELEPERAEGEEAPESSRQKKARKAKGEAGPRKDGAFTKILMLSDDLAAIVGHKYMRRHHAVKAMWAYFKEHDLMDPENRRMVILTDELKKIFGGEERIQAFGMMRYLKDHMQNAEFSDEETRAKVAAECDAMYGGEKSKNGDDDNVATTSRNGTRRAPTLKRGKKAESDELLSTSSDSSDSPPPAAKNGTSGKEAGAGDAIAKDSGESSSSSSSSSDSDSD